MSELDRRRRETPGLQFIVLVDEKFRRKIHDLTTEDRLKVPKFLGWAPSSTERSRLHLGRESFGGAEFAPQAHTGISTNIKINQDDGQVVAPTVERCVRGP